MKRILIVLLFISYQVHAQTVTEITKILGATSIDTTITGAAAQSTLNQNIVLSTAGSGAFDKVAYGPISYESYHIQVIGSAGISAGNIIFEGSNDNVTFTALPFWDDANTFAFAPLFTTITISASTNRYFSGRIDYRYFRCRISTAFAGGTVSAVSTFSRLPYAPVYQSVQNSSPGNVAVMATGAAGEGAANTGSPVGAGGQYRGTTLPTLASGNAGRLSLTQNAALIDQPFAGPDLWWNYPAASGGLLNTTTAVTIRGAQTSARNYITSVQIYAEALGTATELVIRDGAGGTVLWRIKIPTTGMPYTTIQLPVSFKQAAVNTLLEVATLTATTTGAVYINAQGYSAP